MSNQEADSNNHFTVNNENLSVTVTKKPHCHIKFDLTVSPEGVKAAHKSAVKNVKKEVSIPGFRKGKAPDQFIFENYKSAIDEEGKSIVCQTAINEAIHLTKLQPMENRLLKNPVIHFCNEEKGAHITCEFETYIDVPSIKLDDIKLNKVEPLSVKEEDIQNTLQHILTQHATFEPIEDRGVEEHDFVNLSLTLLGDAPQEIVHDQRVEVNHEKIPFWVIEKLMGLKASETAEGMTALDTAFDQPQPDFESKPFQVTIHSISRRVLPEANDDFAKQLKLETLDELKEKIETNLQREAEEENLRIQENELERALIEKYPFDLPRSIVESNKKNRLEAHLKNLEKQNIPYNTQELRNLEKEIEETVTNQIKVHFLYNRVGSENKIQLDQEDIATEISRQIHLSNSGQANIDFSGEKQKVLEQLNQIAIERKIKKFLLEHASYGE